jgi:protein gp37
MQNSKIEWTDHTFNSWIGCTHVSPGCEHCYAETLMDRRYGRAEWGKGRPRARTSAANWRKPLAWNKAAASRGTRARVFCASLADWLDEEVSIEWLADLLTLIERTPYLDWLLLSKRIGGWSDRLHRVVRETHDGADMFASRWLDGDAPPNVWVGTSVEDQRRAAERIPQLRRVPARVRFLSCEPLLGAVDLSRWLPDLNTPLVHTPDGDAPPGVYDPLTRERYPDPAEIELHWVICGGESGAGARPMHPDWARSLRDQCQAAGANFFFKQWGEFGPWPDDQPFNERTQAFQWQRTVWDSSSDHWTTCYEPHYRVGKHAAGRLLDGVEWSEFPVPA